MPVDAPAERLVRPPLVTDFAPRLLAHSAQHLALAAFLEAALADVADACSATYVGLVRGERGRWNVLAACGRTPALPFELLADTLDADEPRQRQRWTATPLARRTGRGELLVVESGMAPAELRKSLDPITAALHSALTAARLREQQQQRIRRLETLLEVAGQWRQTLEMDALLQSMAEASTRLLGAERASIFLWDRPNKLLVGRPALGVEGGELRVPDNSGIVGQVVHSGEPRRVNADEDQHEINRQVDRQLGFRTRSLLCVPLRGASGELFGAFEMINKVQGQFTDDDEVALTELAKHAAIALENTQQYGQLLKTRNQMADQAASRVRLIGECPKLQALRSTVRRVADTELAVLILGENGTGKEVVSQLLHYGSRRRNEPLIAVNCAAIAESLLESELFGHEKGAFTDARETRVGKFELANGGTLFLDEIGDMSLSGQAKLLRVLEEKIVIRVGGVTPIHTDARVIAATNQNLAEMVRQKRFREDLFFRLNVVSLELPPLRERGDDVLVLAQHFLGDFCTRARRPRPEFTAAAQRRLLAHPWPGNVRELRNLMERLAYLTSGDKVDVDDLSFTLLTPGDRGVMSLNQPLTTATREFQSDYIQRHIQQARNNMSLAAETLGLHRSNLYRKMRQLGMQVSDEDE